MFILFIGFGCNDVEPKSVEPTCIDTTECDAEQYCFDSACLDKVSFGESCQTFDSCSEGAFCLIPATSEEGTCYSIPDECGSSGRSGCECHPQGQESPLCEEMIQCDDDEASGSYILTCENDMSPSNLEGTWLDMGRVSDGPQCSRKAEVVIEPGEAPDGCPGCDIVFNARLEFWEDGCGLLPEEVWYNGLYAPFGLRGDKEFLYYRGEWLEQDIAESQRERRWRSYSSFNGYWETYTSGSDSLSFFHNIYFDVTW